MKNQEIKKSGTVSLQTFEAYKRIILNQNKKGGADEREFIKACFFGGDAIKNESEFEIIVRELRRIEAGEINPGE